MTKKIKAKNEILCLFLLLLFLLPACVHTQTESKTRETALSISVDAQPQVMKSYNNKLKSYEQGMTSETAVKSFERSLETQPKIKAKRFSDIFYQARGLNKETQIFLSDVVTAYILDCCSDKQTAVELLEANGFEVSELSAEKIKDKQARKQMFIENEDDAVFWALRKGERALWLQDEWRVTLYFRENKLDRAWSKIVRR